MLGENPIANWKKSAALCIIEPRDPKRVIIRKTMSYSSKDKEEFLKQIKELEDMNLIRPSKSPHNSAAFFVQNHAKIIRKKKRMVIGYR